MAQTKVEGTLQASQYSLKAALFSLFTIVDKIKNKPWAKLGIYIVGPLYIIGFMASGLLTLAKAYYEKNKNILDLFKLRETSTQNKNRRISLWKNAIFLL